MDTPFWKINGKMMTDREVVDAILMGKERVIIEFFYVKCQPLLSSLFDNFYTNCENVKEFTDEIYLHLVYPQEKSHEPALASFNFESPLISWLKKVATNYCISAYEKNSNKVMQNPVEFDPQKDTRKSDESITSAIATQDIERVIDSFKNQTYRTILKMRYVQEMDHEEIQKAIGVQSNYYYVMHKRSKSMLITALSEEGLL